MQHHEKATADHLGLNYVTERILASVLPNRNAASIQHQQYQLRHLHDTKFSSNDQPHSGWPSIDELPQDIYEQELISMLEQKHGKVRETKNLKELLFCVSYTRRTENRVIILILFQLFFSTLFDKRNSKQKKSGSIKMAINQFYSTFTVFVIYRCNRNFNLLSNFLLFFCCPVGRFLSIHPRFTELQIVRFGIVHINDNTGKTV